MTDFLASLMILIGSVSILSKVVSRVSMTVPSARITFGFGVGPPFRLFAEADQSRPVVSLRRRPKVVEPIVVVADAQGRRRKR